LLDWTTSTLEAERQVEEKGMTMNRSLRPRGCSLLMADPPLLLPIQSINQPGAWAIRASTGRRRLRELGLLDSLDS
jgi:hypothetical protein